MADDDVARRRRGGGPGRPYFDTALRSDRAAYIDFLKRLADADISAPRAAATGAIAPFFAGKQDGGLRLALGCRSANARFWHAPRTEIAADESISMLEVPDGGQRELRVASADVERCFHRRDGPGDLGLCFGMPKITKAEASAPGRGCFDGGPPIREGQAVFPALAALPMGRGWAF